MPLTRPSSVQTSGHHTRAPETGTGSLTPKHSLGLKVNGSKPQLQHPVPHSGAEASCQEQTRGAGLGDPAAGLISEPGPPPPLSDFPDEDTRGTGPRSPQSNFLQREMCGARRGVGGSERAPRGGGGRPRRPGAPGPAAPPRGRAGQRRKARRCPQAAESRDQVARPHLQFLKFPLQLVPLALAALQLRGHGERCKAAVASAADPAGHQRPSPARAPAPRRASCSCAAGATCAVTSRPPRPRPGRGRACARRCPGQPAGGVAAPSADLGASEVALVLGSREPVRQLHSEACGPQMVDWGAWRWRKGIAGRGRFPRCARPDPGPGPHPGAEGELSSLPATSLPEA